MIIWKCAACWLEIEDGAGTARHMRDKQWWVEDEWQALLASPMLSAVQ